ncbi:GNAT family N-acetyltransferase [Chelatococcus albus]|uniref:GNAT family N-acetyltransferase n=1 Tax=Chelatococcus albus TaxID=3047466 RepID=UPI0024BD5873|nr:GNAT family N-acetyltransferase [Chelatococcus sp. SYSU_G07232]
MTIRNVEPADVAAVRALLVETWHATYDAVFGAEKVTAITDDWHSFARLTREISEPRAVVLLAELGGRIVATLAARSTEDEGLSLSRLYVLPEAQGRGIGRLLLDATLARFPGAKVVRLEVEPQNAPAIRFYEACGFTRLCGTVGCGGRADIPAVVMERQLTPPGS